MSQFKKKLTTFGALLAFLSVSTAAVHAEFTVDNVINHTPNVDITTSADRLNTTITAKGDAGDGAFMQTTANNVLLDSNQSLGFLYSGIGQTHALVSDGQMKIDGYIYDGCASAGCSSFQQTGKVLLIDPNGIQFGAGSRVNVNSMTLSTLGFDGIQTMKGFTDEQMAQYQQNVLNKMNPFNNGAIHFSSDTGSGFVYVPGASIDINGADLYANKSFNMVADNINYVDSILRTGDSGNYIDSQGAKSFSNVSLVTADGVTFKYKVNGYSSSNSKVDADSKTDLKRNINIDNKGLLAQDPTKTAIQTGDLYITNNTNAAGSNVNISNSIVRATKMVNDENGNILITSNHDINIDKSRLHAANNPSVNTTNYNGGELVLNAKDNVNVKNSLLLTDGAVAGTLNSSASAVDKNTGRLYISAKNGKANIENSKLIAQGNTYINGGEEVNIENSLVKVENVVDTSEAKDLNVTSNKKITIKNTIADASGNIDVKVVDANNALTGEINIVSDVDENGMNQTIVAAGKKLALKANNTTIDNATLAYDNITFYEDGTTGLNNVTVKNGSTFSEIKLVDGAKKVGDDINLKTNGNLVFDNATVQRGAYSIKFSRDNDGNVIDDGTVDAIDFTYKIAKADARDLNATSTEKDVTVTNSSNINTTRDINITSEKGAVNITNNGSLNGKNNVNVTAYKTVTFGKQGAADVTIDDTAKLVAGNNMNITSTGGDINAEKTTMPTLTYGNRLAFNAKGDNNFTSEDSLKSVNVDYKAGGANKFYTKGDIQFVNSSLEAPNNFVESGHDVILNGLTVKKATENAKDTVTQIFANGNVTTDDVTGTAQADANAAVKKFPQSVSTDRTGTGKTTLDINKTKLKITTEVVKDPANPSNGSITLNLKNADNVDAGIELTAQNVDKLDKDPTGGYFREGYYLSGGHKWDEKIEPLEGPEVHLDADDDNLAISKIITDKLFLDKNDTFYASDADLTPDQLAGLPEGAESKGYIEVRDQGGFNFDDKDGYDPKPDDFDYTGNYDSHTVKVEGGIESTTKNGPYIISKKTETKDDVITTTTKYGEDTTTTKTDRITTYNDKKHTIKFDKNGNEKDFILVYDKTRTETEKFEPKTTTRVWDVVETENCPSVPPVDPDEPDVTNADSYINVAKIPKEQLEVSKTSKVSDNTIDQTSNIMSAAAKVDLSGEEDEVDDTASVGTLSKADEVQKISLNNSKKKSKVQIQDSGIEF